METSKGYDAGKLSFVSKTETAFEFIGRTRENYGVQGYVDRLGTEPNNENTISVSQVGAVHAQVRKSKWYSSQNVFVLTPKDKKLINLLVVSAIDKILVNYGGYGAYPTLKSLREHKIQLPVKNGEIDFSFMDSFISELEEERISELAAYLTVSGLDNYELSKEEKQALDDIDSGNISWGRFTYRSVFNKIAQGRRLKKDDQLKGDIPFVMSGTTNTGVVGYISNPVAKFPKNSITLDIFGNAFYRSYDFGAGDDTGVYWNTEIEYSDLAMLFFAASMERSVLGKFSYGKKLRSSQSFDIHMSLPERNGDIDISYMETLISAVQKLVIKDVVRYADRRIAFTKEAIQRD